MFCPSWHAGLNALSREIESQREGTLSSFFFFWRKCDMLAITSVTLYLLGRYGLKGAWKKVRGKALRRRRSVKVEARSSQSFCVELWRSGEGVKTDVRREATGVRRGEATGHEKRRGKATGMRRAEAGCVGIYDPNLPRLTYWANLAWLVLKRDKFNMPQMGGLSRFQVTLTSPYILIQNVLEPMWQARMLRDPMWGERSPDGPGFDDLSGYLSHFYESVHECCIASRNGQFLSTSSDKFTATDHSAKVEKVEEAETVKVPPPPTEKLLVLGGNGFVGSHICKEALDHGLVVASLSRSGRASIQESWANNVIWHQGNLFTTDSWKDALKGVTSIISCVGGFGSNSEMYKINGTANMNAIRAASEEGVKRFVYISAADFGVVNYLLKGYYEGKRAAETELLTRYPYGGVILRPGFIYGTRSVGSMKLPLGVIGSPLEMVLQHTKPLNQVPLVGPLLTPPVNVTAVAKVAVRAATDPIFPPGIVDVYGILRYSKQR
ncbi:NAD(P)-binding Rossmann-fold superfamily protein [Striga asiatica]|uniref:NAD(P)-binding Rossmann-fold superfamily protein n=1 Tax=Striga asiatica TaxID=4170 RepID=A0A5A7PP52_STRAF|nr:NAD(P)-binding Rossmann-fold superfamily protein [Striga asiatica]